MAEKRKIYKKSIHSIKEIAQNVFVLSFARNFEFRAGQVVAVDVVTDGEPRLYSIASGELAPYLPSRPQPKEAAASCPSL